MRFLLDTNTVSVPAAAKPNPAILAKLEAHGHEACIGAPIWHELTFGCERLPAGRRRDAFERYLHEVVQVAFAVLPYDEAAATWHARERARLQGLGRPAPYVDGQIAAIASVAGLTLVTCDVKDFASFQGLDVVDWSKRRSRRR